MQLELRSKLLISTLSLALATSAMAGSTILTTNTQIFTSGGCINFKQSKTRKALYLFQNISEHTLIIDFPPAHIGATAWITQEVKPQQWLAYYYIKGKQKLKTDNGWQNPYWQCFVATAIDDPVDCQHKLKAYTVNLRAQGLPRFISTMVQYKTTWWKNITQNEVKTILS